MTPSREYRPLRLAAALLGGVLACACGWLPAGTPKVVAHRFGSGNWPQNSRTALRGALSRGYLGVEFDLGLTKDGVPVIEHDPFLNPARCTRADGSAIEGEILIKDLTLDELIAGYRCGGIPDPQHPEAQVVADTLLTLDEVLLELDGHPDVTLHLDVKYEPGLTLDAGVFAEAIIGRLEAAHLPNPWYISCAEPAGIAAFKARGASEVIMTLPRVPRGQSEILNAIGFEVLSQLGVADALSIARSAGATGLNIAYQVADRRLLEAARSEGLSVHVWTPNSPALLGTYCAWPADAVITDYPERAPCL